MTPATGCSPRSRSVWRTSCVRRTPWRASGDEFCIVLAELADPQDARPRRREGAPHDRPARASRGTRREDDGQPGDGGLPAGRLAAAQPTFPPGLSDRAEDAWEPLLAIADLAGDEWAVRAREAAVALHQARECDEDNDGTLILAICRRALAERDRSIRQGTNANHRGYKRDHFLDAWERYLPPGHACACCRRGCGTAAGNCPPPPPRGPHGGERGPAVERGGPCNSRRLRVQAPRGRLAIRDPWTTAPYARS